MAGVAEELTFAILFHSNLNSHMWLVARVFDGTEIKGHDTSNSPSNHSLEVHLYENKDVYAYTRT